MRARAVTSVILLAVALAAPAAAHIALRYPPSRYGDSVLKEGPCGLAGGMRSDNVTELESGARIDVTWDEYVDHPGHFRISFDADGDDGFADPVCLSGCNTTSPQFEFYANPSILLDDIADTPDGGLSTVSVTLPDVECDNCTLQVIQVMYDKPPYESGGNDIYYQCADLVLRRAAPPACAGDCNGDHRVTVEEVITGIGILLGSEPMADCSAADADGDGHVAVADIIRAVASALSSCPP